MFSLNKKRIRFLSELHEIFKRAAGCRPRNVFYVQIVPRTSSDTAYSTFVFYIALFLIISQR